MEEKKRKFNFHVEICEAKDQVLVTADAEKPLIGEMLACAAKNCRCNCRTGRRRQRK